MAVWVDPDISIGTPSSASPVSKPKSGRVSPLRGLLMERAGLRPNDVPAEMTVCRSLKQLIELATGVPASWLQLVVRRRGRMLDDRRLCDYDVFHDASIDLTVKPGNGVDGDHPGHKFLAGPGHKDEVESLTSGQLLDRIKGFVNTSHGRVKVRLDTREISADCEDGGRFGKARVAIVPEWRTIVKAPPLAGVKDLSMAEWPSEWPFGGLDMANGTMAFSGD